MRWAGVAVLLVVGMLPAAGMAQGVDVIGMDPDPATLAEALAVAPAGAEIVVTGRHPGNFVIDRPLTLRGAGDAVLDGGGAGTVLTIRADDVTVADLALTGSALSDDYWQAWGPAGLRVEGDRAMLTGLTVTGNGWGVLFMDGEGSVLRESRVDDNQRDGVTIIAGTGHEIARNAIDGNRTGIVVQPRFGDSDRVLLPPLDNPAGNAALAQALAAATPAVGHRILANTLDGNAETGILLHYDVRETRVARNSVHDTGIGRAPDAAEAAFWAEAAGGPTYVPVDTQGSGILLFCGATGNVVAANRVADNRAIGIGVEQGSDRNTVERNVTARNAIGIDVAGSSDNVLRANRVTANTDVGILIDRWLWLGQGRSGGNLVTLNDLTGNAVNAFDGAGAILTADEIAAQIPLVRWPEQMRAAYANPAVVAQMAQAMAAGQVPAANRWDDGRFGNRHDDFDAPAEGFIDRDGDGIGEAGRIIPDSGATDSLPLTEAALAAALAGG